MKQFRCKECGFVHSEEHAGENELPHACCVCGSGISWDKKTGAKLIHPKNWQVLVDGQEVESPADNGPDTLTVGQLKKRKKVSAEDGPGTTDGA